jgi:ABC-type oligopeptide transport system substrate-binding subunit
MMGWLYGMGLLLAWLALAPVAAEADVYRRGEPGEPETLDPQKTQTVVEADIVYDLFEGLLSYDAEGRLAPGVATAWTVSDDGLTYSFDLREEDWSNGDPVTAEDFVFSFRRLIDPATAAPYASLFFPMKNAQAVSAGHAAPGALGVRALGAHRLEIALERPTPYFLGLLAHQTAVPLHRASLEKYGAEFTRPGRLVGNGAYVLTGYRPGDKLTFDRNPHFHAAAEVAIAQEDILPLEDRAAAVRRFEAGEIESYADAPSDQIAYLKQKFPGELHLSASLGTYYYAFNTKKPPFDDVRVRRALSMTIDREFLAQTLWGGSMLPAYALTPPGLPGAEPVKADFADLAPIDAEEEAKRLLKAAGYGPGGRTLNVEIRYNTSENHQTTAIAVADMWRPLNVATSFVNTDAKTHFAFMREHGDFDVARAGWLADYPDPQNFLMLAQSGNEALNYSRWSNPDYDALLAKAESERDVAARAHLLAEAEAILLREQPIAPLMFLQSKNLVSKRVRGWRANLLDRHLTRYLSLAP